MVGVRVGVAVRLGVRVAVAVSIAMKGVGVGLVNPSGVSLTDVVGGRLGVRVGSPARSVGVGVAVGQNTAVTMGISPGVASSSF